MRKSVKYLNQLREALTTASADLEEAKFNLEQHTFELDEDDIRTLDKRTCNNIFTGAKIASKQYDKSVRKYIKAAEDYWDFFSYTK